VLEHARQFLSRVLPPLEGQGAYLNIHWSSPASNEDGTPKFRENGERMKWWDGRACSTIDEALKTIKWVSGQAGKDVYVCMSLQSKMELKTSAKGNQYKKALRLADDVAAIRSLFIDIDVKEGAYGSTSEALAALKGFIDTVGLPLPSACVASGSGGFHAHWALDRVLTRDEWQVLANRLADATKKHGLITDSQCTVDSARILRIPATKNHKTEPPREVTLMSLGGEVSFDAVAAALAPYDGAAAPQRSELFEQAPTTVGPGANNDELAANMPQGSAAEIRVEDVGKSCPFIARTLATGGRDNPQPLWFMTASMATFMEDGRDALHAMSNKHPGYSIKETDELYDRAEANGKKRDLGWPKCAKISSYGAPECANCPLLAQGKSPLNFAKPTSPVALVDNTLPDRYVRNGDGTISMRHVNDDSSIVLIQLCHYPIINGWLSNNPWTFHFTTRTEAGRKSVVEIPTEVIFAKDGLAKFLGSKGFFLTDKQYKLLKEFFVSWLQKLQNSKESVVSASPFGWSVVDGKTEGFTYAGRVWMKDGDRPAANPNPQLQYQYTPKGDIAPWREVAKVVYEQNRPGLNAMLAVAFAAPLVRFTGFGGLILNAFSPESGIGKTTAMKVSQAVWGSPVLAMQGLDDTANSVLGKMGQLRSLPMYWDEIKSDAQIKRFCSVVFNLTGGREKTRMNADATLRVSGTWQTMMVSASNDSLIDGMAREAGSTTAGLHRLFEFQVPKPDKVTHDIGTVQRLTGKLDDNYGHAGLVYAKFLGTNYKRVEQEVADLQDRLYSEAQVQQEERMWIATMAVVLKGAEYANELGLVDIDIDSLKIFLFDVLVRMRKEVQASPTDLTNDMSVSSILAEFLNATRARNTLVTNRIWVSRGKPSKGAIQVQSDTSKLGDICVHLGKEDRLMRISSTFFSRWMGDHGYSRQTWTKRMEQEFGLKTVHGKLGGGTEMVCAMEYLIELDLNHPKLAQFIE
jgi:Domain of unknown function (DUF927)